MTDNYTVYIYSIREGNVLGGSSREGSEYSFSYGNVTLDGSEYFSQKDYCVVVLDKRTNTATLCRAKGTPITNKDTLQFCVRRGPAWDKFRKRLKDNDR